MAQSALAFGAVLLDQVQNIGQVMELGQNHAHQKESMYWQKRSFFLDVQSVRLDALDHAKEEIKSHYDTYCGRIDTLLLVLALIFPFALNVIQFSDYFVPATPAECEECVEAKYQWLVTVWSCLIGVVLVLPFWGILMLIRCKLKLDRWLEYSLAGLHQRRRDIVAASDPNQVPSSERLNKLEKDEETEQIVYQLVNMVLRYQEFLARMWNAELGRLVMASTAMLWMSASSALMLTALSMWIFLINKGDEHTVAGYWFACIITVGCLGPAFYLLGQALKDEVKPPVSEADEIVEGHFYTDGSFPLAKRASGVATIGDDASPVPPSTCASSGSPPAKDPSEGRVAPPLGRSQTGGWCARRRGGGRALPRAATVGGWSLLGASSGGVSPLSAVVAGSTKEPFLLNAR